MSKEELVNKIIEMYKEAYELGKNDISVEDLLKAYVEAKAHLETIKVLKELERGKE